MNPPIQTETDGKQRRLLIIDDEANMRHMLQAMFADLPYRIETATDGSDGLDKIEKAFYDFILCDMKMPKMNGIEFLKSAGDKLSETTVIMMSAYGSIDAAVEAMKLGAYDFISKPFKADEIRLILKKAEERDRLKRENVRLRQRIEKIQEHTRFHQMVGSSHVIQAVFKLAKKVSQYHTTVLITGESGTGKELIARGIHFFSDRVKKPFVAVNCGGIPENLLESELFGHKKGAFTGADRDKKGLYEEASGGTLLLDEIGEMPADLQVKLLRVLQESEIRPVGASKPRKVDVRVIAATAKHLEDEISRGTFREDLFYRLNVVRITVPPLRDWAEDIPVLARHFINRFNEKFEKQISGVSPEAMAILLEHRWPGNVRELEHAIERAVLLSEDTLLKPEQFSSVLEHRIETDSQGVRFDGFSLKAARRFVEAKLIQKALDETGGNRTRAAKILEISHPSLLSKMKTYGIK